MADENPPVNLNPHTFLTDPLDIFEAVAIPVLPGTTAPARPLSRERMPGQEMPVTEPFGVFESESVPLQTGMKAPPRPPGKERNGQDQVGLLVARIENALRDIHAALDEIKQIQSKAG